MKIKEDEAISIAKNVIEGLGTPYDSVNASYVENGAYWLIAFEGRQGQDMLDGNVSFVTVNAETGAASLRPHP
jgi:hypothetical protein